jgi:hypothetical protein
LFAPLHAARFGACVSQPTAFTENRKLSFIPAGVDNSEQKHYLCENWGRAFSRLKTVLAAPDPEAAVPAQMLIFCYFFC